MTSQLNTSTSSASNNHQTTTTTNNNSNHHHHHHQNGSIGGSDSVSLNESTTTNGEPASGLATHQNEENYKQMYMDMLYNFECERLNFQLNQSGEEMAETDERLNTVSDVMCIMMEAICDENENYHSIDAKIIEEAVDNDDVVLNGNCNDKNQDDSDSRPPSVNTISSNPAQPVILLLLKF